MITPHEEAIVKKWNSEIRHAIRMRLSLTEDEQSNLFREYCDHLMRIAPQIRIENDSEEEDRADDPNRKEHTLQGPSQGKRA